jgi:nucleotidyltransferase/DNA polymerase involved in DNA repair
LVLFYFDGDAFDAKAERRRANDERSTSVALNERPIAG